MEVKKINRGLVVALIIFVVVSIVSCGYLAYDKLGSQPDDGIEITYDEKDAATYKTEGSKASNESSTSTSKRLYMPDDYRRYLLLTDTKGIHSDCDEHHSDCNLEWSYQKDKTYILDLNDASVKEIDLASKLKPFVDTYISEKCASFDGEIFATYTKFDGDIEYREPKKIQVGEDSFIADGPVPVKLDKETEIGFEVHYKGVGKDGGESNLGSEIYAYNVETGALRIIDGKSY